jgi:hypothetical protein
VHFLRFLGGEKKTQADPSSKEPIRLRLNVHFSPSVGQYRPNNESPSNPFIARYARVKINYCHFRNMSTIFLSILVFNTHFLERSQKEIEVTCKTYAYKKKNGHMII